MSEERARYELSKEEFLEKIPGFIQKYNRLPYIQGDQVELIIVEDGNTVIKPFSTDKYITKFFKTQESFIDYLFKNKTINYQLISNNVKLNENQVEALYAKKIKTPEIKNRRQLEIFLGIDVYKSSGVYNSECSSCKRKCKQHYWVSVGCDRKKTK